jgi:hypothetical protein
MSSTDRPTIDLAAGLKMFLQDLLTLLQSIEKLWALFDVRFASESFERLLARASALDSLAGQEN